MPNFTKRAIKASFMKLLNEKPLNKISVRDIVEDCGINRNSFYYHFQDIPALIEEIVTECFDALIQKYPGIPSLKEGFKAAFEFALENKKAMLHIYNSVNRDIFERSLMQFCEYLIQSYLAASFGNAVVSETDQGLIIRFLKCELFGAYIEWMNSGMSENVIEEVNRMFEICHGLSDEIICRCNADIAQRKASYGTPPHTL